jgi:undecaprenyl-diphosphatase
VPHDLNALEAAAAGLLQGVAVVFPISGLGHGVIVSSLGDNAGADIAPAHAAYLYAYLRVAVGVALLVYFWRDWFRVGRGLVSTVARGAASQAERRWAGLVLLGVLPSAIAIAVIRPHVSYLAGHPRLAAACLAGNGLLLLVVWIWFRRSPRSGGLSGAHRAPLTRAEDAEAFAIESSAMRPGRMVVIGLLPLAAVVPGISGVGLAICAGLLFGLTQEHAARVALLVLTPMLLVWGLVELPDLGSSEFDAVRTAVLIASGAALVGAYLCAALLVRYFRTASLRLFGYYCLAAGLGSLYFLSR